MSEDRTERQIAFIIDQQAKFTTDIAALQEGQRQNMEHIRKLTEALLSLTHVVEKHDEDIAENAEHIAENTKQIAALVEQGKYTDARLNALITVVERHVSDHSAKR